MSWTWISFRNLLSRICFRRLANITVVVHSLLDKLVELIDRDVFKRAILSLAHEPYENLLECILLSLVIREVESIARLFVEGCQGVGWIYEAVFERGEVGLRSGPSNHGLWVDFLALGLRKPIWVQWYGLLGHLWLNLLIIDLSSNLRKTINSSLSCRVALLCELVIVLALILPKNHRVLLLIVTKWWILHWFFVLARNWEFLFFRNGLF